MSCKIVGKMDIEDSYTKYEPEEINEVVLKNGQIFRIGDNVIFKLSKNAPWNKGYFSGMILSFPKGIIETKSQRVVKIMSPGFTKKFNLETVKVKLECLRTNKTINIERKAFLNGLEEIQALKRAKQKVRGKKVKKGWAFQGTTF